MNPKILSLPILRPPVSAWSTILLLAAACASFAVAAETASQPSTTRPAPEPAAAKRVEDIDALFARLTKLLNYGSDMGMAKPSKNDAIIALGVIGDERAVPVLAEHLANNENKFLRLRIVRALGWIGGQQAISALGNALKDEYPLVRKQAADVLQQLTGRSYEYDKTGVPEVAAQIATEAPSSNDTRRLDEVAREVATRREIRQAAMAGTETQLKKKIVEPIDIDMANQPVGLVAKTYSDLTGKLVLVNPKISKAAITCKIEKATFADAKATLNKVLLEAGVQVVELEHGVVAFIPANAAKPAETSSKP